MYACLFQCCAFEPSGEGAWVSGRMPLAVVTVTVTVYGLKSQNSRHDLELYLLMKKRKGQLLQADDCLVLLHLDMCY